jgi:hypothetical protein
MVNNNHPKDITFLSSDLSFTVSNYLLSFLSQIGEALDFTRPFNIFTYYEPQALMFNKGNFILDIIVLSALIMICFGISLKQFGKRDIP